jgi:hypothetical protein
MTTWKEIIIQVLLLISFYIISTNFIPDNLLFAFVFNAILVLAYVLILKKMKDAKRASEIFSTCFAEMNYTILSERPLTFKEQYANFEFNFGPSIRINGIYLNNLKYKNKMKRLFIVRNEKEHDFELIVTIMQTWRDKIKYSIDSTSRIRD